MAAVDQISKLLVRSMMNVGDTHTVWTGVLEFTYYQNSGAARSMFQGYGRLFGVISVLFVIGVFYYRRTRRAGRYRMLDFGLAMLAAGAAGNGIERLLFGKVTDFLVFGSGGGILNLADLMINAGVLAVIFDTLFLAKKRSHALQH